MKSASSSPGTPQIRNGYAEGLYAKWQLTDSAKLRTPLSATALGAINREDSVDDGDDDIFGSGAWRRQRKKRAKAKEEGSAVEEAKTRRKKGAVTWEWVNHAHSSLQLLRDQVYSSLPVWLQRRLTLPLPAEDIQQRLGTPTANGTAVKTSPQRKGYELTTECLVHQARVLCGNYIYQRLSAKGLLNKRVNVSPYDDPLADELYSAGQELERLYPRTYTDISRRISMTMTSAQIVRRALTSVLNGIFNTGINWAKVVSMMAIAAAFAEECVVQGHPNFVEDVVMCVGHFVTMHLAIWLAQHGGWSAFPRPKKPDEEKKAEGSLVLAVLVILLLTAVVILMILKVFWDRCDVTDVIK